MAGIYMKYNTELKWANLDFVCTHSMVYSYFWPMFTHYTP